MESTKEFLKNVGKIILRKDNRKDISKAGFSISVPKKALNYLTSLENSRWDLKKLTNKKLIICEVDNFGRLIYAPEEIYENLPLNIIAKNSEESNKKFKHLKSVNGGSLVELKVKSYFDRCNLEKLYNEKLGLECEIKDSKSYLKYVKELIKIKESKNS